MICLNVSQFSCKVLEILWILSIWKLLSFLSQQPVQGCNCFSSLWGYYLGFSMFPSAIGIACFLLTSFFSLFPYLCFKFYFVSSSALLRNPSDFCFLKMCWHRSSSLISFPISFNVIIARYSQRGKIKCMWSTSHFNWWERAWEICFFLIVPVLSIH